MERAVNKNLPIKLLKLISNNIEETTDVRIENCVGFTQVPLGLAGPLQINGQFQQRTVYAPLATVEPTLVASCSRGCKAFQASGGVQAAVLSEGMSRAPVFAFRSVDKAVLFYHSIPKLEARFRASGESTSKYARLVKATPQIIGSTVHVKFQYTCGDAGGQNMVTIATQRACQDLLASPDADRLGIVDFQVEGQLASDKKLSWGNVQEPRGVEVLAWASISDEVCRVILGCSTTRLQQVISMFQEGGTRNGQMGQNINTANILAAMFIACGQDAASVLESGWSHLTAELNPTSHDLTLSLYFPSMLVGTVGGGTDYPTQKEALELIGCYGAGRKWALAETVAAFALALDVSTVSAIADNTFAASHERLARGEKTSKL
jgi:NADP-dependent 3-hydroxy-3-methylglutaryl-CoA reductase